MFKKQRGPLVIAVLLMSLVIGWSSYAAASTQVPREVCARKLASQINPRLMNRETALRKTRVLCDRIKKQDPYLWKALTQ